MANNNTLQNVLAHLKEQNVTADYQKETDQIVVVKKIEGIDFPLFIRFLDEGKLMQMIAFIPCNVKKESVADLARLLHLLNKEMDLPGFGYDEDSGVVFYRVVMPTLNDQWDKQVFDIYMNSMEIICRSFSPVVINICQGTMTLDAVIQKAQELKGKA
ncbi:MAG: YbjN domain-containing protein [Chlamydiales bacterium]|nr:YbjN domain-containing protein [Chlamydiia bacterium]MCP5508196.1 YbjN domain-containing protein [Chlamydiales bacterium]